MHAQLYNDIYQRYIAQKAVWGVCSAKTIRISQYFFAVGSTWATLFPYLPPKKAPIFEHSQMPDCPSGNGQS